MSMILQSVLAWMSASPVDLGSRDRLTSFSIELEGHEVDYDDATCEFRCHVQLPQRRRRLSDGISVLSVNSIEINIFLQHKQLKVRKVKERRNEMLANDFEKRRRTSRVGTSAASSVSTSSSPALTVANMRKSNAIYAEDVVKVKQALQEKLDSPTGSAPFVDEDGDASWGPVVVSSLCTWKDFERWLNNGGRLRRWVYEPFNDENQKGRVLIYSLPSPVHSGATSAITKSIIEQILEAGNDIHLISSLDIEQFTCRTGDRGQEPDSSLTPVNLTIGGGVMRAAENAPFPNLIVEVAYKNETLRALRAKLVRWMDPTYSSVQVAIGIKIFSANLRRVAILHQLGQPIEEVEFGQNCPGPLTISFRLGAIYTGAVLPPSLTGHENDQIVIDLIALRGVIDARM